MSHDDIVIGVFLGADNDLFRKSIVIPLFTKKSAPRMGRVTSAIKKECRYVCSLPRLSDRLRVSQELVMVPLAAVS